ncbi:platelet-derived growth factor receptor alpha-like [Diabrotica virgifera virgifera]|uniref:Platelet-derived growth factor receptor alpha-like n=1 Tax=Diabrotica virgifera virgifera TaxID=50390 RepID=A0A6P7GQ83_DIAVI|nr:platelet-derived growth factor receptor alpha-like [Diabrotica virgifera virgifera]
MAFKNNIVIFLVFVCELFSVTVVGQSFLMPEILLSEKEYVLEKHENFSILCQGNKPVSWTVPKVKDPIKKTWTTFRINSEKTNNTQYKYGSRLQITNMSYPFVGFYYCHFGNVYMVNETDKVYLFVNDNDNLDVGLDYRKNNTDVIYIQKRAKNSNIHCRPTAPDVDVKLFRIDTGSVEVPLNVLLEETNTMYWYEKYYGISTNDTNFDEERVFSCRFTKNAFMQETVVHFTAVD